MIPAFERTFDDLRKCGMYEGPTPSEDKLTGVLGMILPELWKTLLPESTEETHEWAAENMLKHNVDLLHEGIANLYPGVKEQLQLLREKGVKLFIASNGQEKYISTIVEVFGIADWFTDLYSAGRFLTETKVELVAKLLRDYQVEHAVMVGDRKSDVEAGKGNQLFTIGCDFGFAKAGELDGSDVIIKDFAELTRHIPFPIVQGN